MIVIGRMFDEIFHSAIVRPRFSYKLTNFIGKVGTWQKEFAVHTHTAAVTNHQPRRPSEFIAGNFELHVTCPSADLPKRFGHDCSSFHVHYLNVDGVL